MAIVGAVDPDQALALAREAYGDWPAAPGAVDPSPEEPARREVRARTLRGDVSAGRARRSAGARCRRSRRTRPRSIWPPRCSEPGRGSWLYRALREPGLVTWVDGPLLRAHRARGVRRSPPSSRPARVPQALERDRRDRSPDARSGPSAEELERARTLLRARWARRLESMEGRASALAAAEALDGYDFLDREFEALERGDAGRRARRRGALSPAGRRVRGALPPRRTRATSSPPTGSRRAFAVTELHPPAPAAPAAVARRGRRSAAPTRHAARGGGDCTRACPARTSWSAARRACRSSTWASTCRA